MKNLFKYFLFIRNTMLIMFGINSISKYKNSPGMILFLGCISVFLIINDYARYNRFYKDDKKNTVSTIASMVISAVALIFDIGYMTYYFIGTMDDAFDLPEMWKKILLYFHAGVYAIMVFFSEFRGYSGGISGIFTLDTILEYGPGLLFSGFVYATFLMLIYSYRGMMKERYETNRLNRELSESNRQLQEYAEKVEELTISKERNRVAGELHDSLGHSLTALIMHLDFIEKVMDSDKDRAKELVIKTQSMARDSMNDLRKAVYELKEDKHIEGLNHSINELIHNITSIEGISISYKSYGNVENMSPNLKNIIYRTIQEGMTNGLKHGGASEFSISINVDNDDIRLVIEDNGSGCKKIAKGNGLMGIEERVYALNGSIQYLNDKDMGFGFDISIPIEEVAS